MNSISHKICIPILLCYLVPYWDHCSYSIDMHHQVAEHMQAEWVTKNEFSIEIHNWQSIISLEFLWGSYPELASSNYNFGLIAGSGKVVFHPAICGCTKAPNKFLIKRVLNLLPINFSTSWCYLIKQCHRTWLTHNLTSISVTNDAFLLEYWR